MFCRIKFPERNSVDAYLYVPQESTPGVYKDMFSLSFMLEIKFWQLLFESFFKIINIFCSVQP